MSNEEAFFVIVLALLCAASAWRLIERIRAKHCPDQHEHLPDNWDAPRRRVVD